MIDNYFNYLLLWFTFQLWPKLERILYTEFNSGSVSDSGPGSQKSLKGTKKGPLFVKKGTKKGPLFTKNSQKKGPFEPAR